MILRVVTGGRNVQLAWHVERSLNIKFLRRIFATFRPMLNGDNGVQRRQRKINKRPGKRLDAIAALTDAVRCGGAPRR
jgi:hypothetical protein